VYPLATEESSRFIGDLTLEALADPLPDSPILHIKLAELADAIVVAPASANTIAKMACGLADQVLFDTILAAVCPVIVAPAMNHNMWEHSATQSNIETLLSYGYHVVEPQEGKLACGSMGKGRLAALESIMAAINEVTA
jgi:phosphopantothenoylcysteine decarboxylase/phosphopantothenate--cysteine ligase